MKKVALILAMTLVMASATSMAIANEEEDVRVLVNKAVTFFQEKGQDYSVKVCNALHGPFVKGPLYVFVGTLDGRLIAHPMNKKLLERPLLDLKDINGKLFFQEMIALVKEPGDGWVEYWWAKPGTQDQALKRSYVKRIPGKDIWVGAGYYAN